MTRWTASLLGIALLVLVLGTAHAATTATARSDNAVHMQTAAPPTVLYVLDAASEYVEGCFPAPPFPCAGPLFLYPAFEGIFGLTFAGVDPDGFTVFEVSNVMLMAGAVDAFVLVEGEGVYRRSAGPDAEHQLTLDVTLNGNPALFDSGVVPVPDTAAGIDIAVSMNDLNNYDVLMQIVASPGAPLSR